MKYLLFEKYNLNFKVLQENRLKIEKIKRCVWFANQYVMTYVGMHMRGIRQHGELARIYLARDISGLFITIACSRDAQLLGIAYFYYSVQYRTEPELFKSGSQNISGNVLV